MYIFYGLYIFFITFFLGSYLNNFMIIQQKHYSLSPFISAFIHLLTTILLMYLFHRFHLLYLEDFYSPHIVFSTFLFSLQTNMILNFKKTFNI